MSEVKRRHERKFEVTKASSKRKLANFSKPLSKKIKASVKAEDSDTDSECIDTIASVSKQIRACIAKWVRSQSCIVLKHLKENRDFTVVVTNTPKSAVSNWTRHRNYTRRKVTNSRLWPHFGLPSLLLHRMTSTFSMIINFDMLGLL